MLCIHFKEIYNYCLYGDSCEKHIFICGRDHEVLGQVLYANNIITNVDYDDYFMEALIDERLKLITNNAQS